MNTDPDPIPSTSDHGVVGPADRDATIESDRHRLAQVLGRLLARHWLNTPTLPAPSTGATVAPDEAS